MDLSPFNDKITIIVQLIGRTKYMGGSSGSSDELSKNIYNTINVLSHTGHSKSFQVLKIIILITIISSATNTDYEEGKTKAD